MKVEIANYDKNYPIRVKDGWGNEICVPIDDAKKLLKELEEVIATFDKKPKVSEPEKKVVYFIDNYENTNKAVQITAEQDKFLNWLIKQDYFFDDLEITDKAPDIEDLT